TALSHIERRKIKSSWLQVDQHNSAAIDLYLSLGFLERARRTTWHNRRSAPPTTLTLPPDIKIKRRPAYVWPQQRAWLQQIYPPLISWHLPLNLSLFQAGMVGTATRFVSDRRTRQWAAFRGEQLLGVLSWQNSYAQADRLWLATSPQHEELAVLSLLPHARRKFSMRRRMSLNYPAGRAVDAIQQTGFVNHQTLIWMERPSNL
ncbi:MAG: hypothetical protein OEZ02_14990, partial [Anaerolineae bacterium]|nr:hypothetical protein [Anaerolineae bacterium]